MIRQTTAASVVGLAMAGLVAGPASPQELRTLTLRAKGCSDCIVDFGSLQADIHKRVQLRNGRAQISLPLDAGWYGLGIETAKGMSGGGAETLVVMNYAGFTGGDKVSNRRSKRAPLGTSCAYFYGPETVRFVVKRDPLPKRYWGPPTPGARTWKKYLRAWASPQQDSVTTDMYSPTNKGQLATQNANCDYVP